MIMIDQAKAIQARQQAEQQRRDNWRHGSLVALLAILIMAAEPIVEAIL